MYYGGPTHKELDEAFDKRDSDKVLMWIDEAYEDGFESGQEDVNISGLAEEWIKFGEFDYEVERRAGLIGMIYPPKNNMGVDLLQTLHRATCPDGPYGWEYCGKCNV